MDGFLSFAPDQAAQTGEFDPAFFSDLARYEEKYFWFQSRSRLILWALRRFFPTAHRYMEMGVGSGIVLAHIRQHAPDIELHGSELLAAGLPIAKSRVPEVQLYQMDAKSVPFHQHFDVIGAYDVIEHIEDDLLVLREIHDALTQKGGLILTVPQHGWLWSVADEISYHKRRYNRQELMQKLNSAGFRVVFSTSFVSLLLPMFYVLRKFQKASPENYDWRKEFEISPLLNKMLVMIMKMEGWLIRLGIRFSVGSSLLLVAQRG